MRVVKDEPAGSNTFLWVFSTSDDHAAAEPRDRRDMITCGYRAKQVVQLGLVVDELFGARWGLEHPACFAGNRANGYPPSIAALTNAS